MAAKSKAETQGLLARCSINASPWAFESCGLKAERTYIGYGNDIGASGSVDPVASLYTQTKRNVMGDISGVATYALAKVLARCFFTDTSDTIADDPTDNTVNNVDVRVNRVTGTSAALKYDDCWLNLLKIEGSNANALKWTLGLFGKDEEADAGDPIADMTAGIIASNADVSFTINSNTYFPISWELELNYNLDGDSDESFRQSLTRNVVVAGERIVRGSLTMPFNTDTTADLMASLHDKTYAYGLSIAIANGSDSITIAIPQIILQGDQPEVSNGSKIQPVIEFKAIKKTGNELVTCTIV